jgi:GNAT superfamily N-acetyltransferase
VLRLFAEVGWWPDRTAGDVAAVLGSGPAVGAWDGDQLVGFARAISDGRVRAYIEDVVVAGSHRQAGLGRALIETLNAELAGLDVVSVFFHRDLEGFYGSLGYVPTKQVCAHLRRPR